ncbi:MAG: siphovirus Gp157 family protein [Psychromonas sp.]|nr:siphovirus Gp157 family protein [Candidatus Brocadiaceae bacterium]MCP5079873.1 siphovirus Gp157 family protein [Psychromonas sp.]
MTKLYELTDDFKALNALVDEGELSQEDIEDTLEAINASLNEKVDSICKTIKNMGESLPAIDDEIKRLNDRKKSIKNKQESMKQYLLMQLEKIDKKSVKTELFSVTARKPVDKLVVDDATKLPDDFVEVIMETKPLKAPIMEMLKNGKEVEGARIEQGKKSIQIR